MIGLGLGLFFLAAGLLNDLLFEKGMYRPILNSLELCFVGSVLSAFSCYGTWALRRPVTCAGSRSTAKTRLRSTKLLIPQVNRKLSALNQQTEPILASGVV